MADELTRESTRESDPLAGVVEHLGRMVDATRADLRKLDRKRRRDVAHRFMDAWRAVKEETGYGSIEDAVLWAQRIVEGRGE
jgi:hypothetical protein